MKKLLLSLAVALALASPARARVISYSPFTTEPAETGVHLRTSRWFVLLEGSDIQRRQVTLYDSRGLVEPRAVYTASGESLFAAALHEGADGTPSILILTSVGARFSASFGESWIELPELAWPRDRRDYEIDTGGPYVGGLHGNVRVGSAAWPFVTVNKNGVVYAISAAGATRALPAAGTILGQDRTGTRFIVQGATEVGVVDVFGTYRKLIEHIDYGTFYSGWITPRGAVYLEARRRTGRNLYLFRNGRFYFVAGPEAPLRESYPRDLPSLRFFAVPTHDFTGAWMIERGPGQPTRLLRHAPGREVELMWSDPAGREVEALIAGESGQTLLVQVHVPRDVSVAVPFIDPALAVWHVGEPHPAVYDELYLNEERNKGFVHVDVDAIEGGDPFVFSSGTERFEMPEEGPVSPPPPTSGGGEVVQEWGVVRASLKQRLVLPGVARSRGAFGSVWSTDITIYNPLDEPQDVAVLYAPLDHQVSSVHTRRAQTVRIGAREIAVIPDVLHSLFLVANGGGTLFFEPAAGVNVVARTYSRTERGTYGYGMLAIDFFNAAGPRFPLYFSGAFPGPNFRTNVVVTDTSGRGAAAALHAHGPTGRVATFTSPATTLPGGVQQMSASSSLDASALVVAPSRGFVIPAVVAIDNRTNDPTYFPPDVSATVARSIPIITHQDRPDGTPLRSDLYLFNPSSSRRTVTLEAKLWDRTMRRIEFVRLEPGEARLIPDAMQTLFKMKGSARLRVMGEGVRVTSRMYTIDADGGTYGALVPPLNNFQIAAPGDALEIHGISGGDAFRTNLGLVELSQTNTFSRANIRVRIYDEKHRELASFDTAIDSGFGQQLDDLFASRNIPTPRAAMIVVEVLDGGLVGAYVTLTDKGTNDTTYLPANLAAK